jgi:hypothetical protein
VAPLEPPIIDVLDDNTTGDIRTLRLRIGSPRHAPIISVHLDRSTEVIQAAVNGTRINNGARPEQWGLRFFGLSPAGFELTLKVKATRPTKIRVIDQSYGLPELPGTPLKARPEGIIPAPSVYSDLTLVDKLLNL